MVAILPTLGMPSRVPQLRELAGGLAFMLVLLSACSSGTTVSDKDIPDANGQRETISDVPPVDVIPDVQREIDWKGTDAQWDIPQQECIHGQGHFGCPCVGADDCLSGWCQLHLGDMVCTQVCVTECPDGFSCVTVGATDPVSICTSRFPSLCLPCRKDGDCDGKNTACLNYGSLQGSFCTQKCSSGGDCPEGFDCETRVTVTGATFKGCVASSGECSCTEYAILGGLNTECRISNTHGNCSGVRECGEEGLTPCDALTPEPETCDGVDNDCNGATDEGELCDDGNECTNTWCDGVQGCQIGNLDQPCTDDGDPCTVDVCVNGVCTHPPGNDGATCAEDGNVCTLDVCVEGTCTHPAGNDGAPCDDGDPCTLDEICNQGICTWTRLNPLCQAICGDGVCSTLESGDPASQVYCAVDCGACGDGICGLHEMGSNGGSCPKDCLAVCGNGKCEGGESTTTCILDCSGCGDGLCGMNESFLLCPADCPPACGNGICEMFENPQVCPVDCMPPCGDGICSSGESPQSCPVDCPVCGDGVCGTGETIASCPQDCATACGNGICEGGETAEGCPVDCGHCGDGVCGYHERPDTCPLDCFQGCGDGVCAMGETCITCPMDCGQCCGNGLCEASGGESTCTCPVDCGQCQGCCSANVCRVGTSHSYCGMDGAACLDCGALHMSCVDQECVPICGDGRCHEDEDCANCPDDCGCTGCGETCVSGVCSFTACDGKECGEDGCGGNCGTCEEHHQCQAGSCVYVPWCGDGTCDPGENCLTCPPDCGCTGCGETCESGVCTFTACDGKECGDDGCGGSCGICGEHHVCTQGICQYVPWCGDGTCEPDEDCDSCPDDCDYCNGTTFGFVRIPAGSFWMGSPDGMCPEGYPGSCESELGRHTNEALHFVQLTRDFEMSEHEITQRNWKTIFNGTNPSHFASCGDSCPVEQVTWFSVLEYLNLLSASRGYPECYEVTECSDGTAASGTLAGCTVNVTGSGGNPYNCSGYRLPTEAEWEYAYRAGSTTAVYPSEGNDGSLTQVMTSPLDPNLDEIGWYRGNSHAAFTGAYQCSGWYAGATTCGIQPVGGKASNEWGLYDMSGNVEEWVWDWYSDSYSSGTFYAPLVNPLGQTSGLTRLVRGGGWHNDPNKCRAAWRYNNWAPGTLFFYVGARPVRTLLSECSTNCAGNECGEDGCGGSCGSCRDHHECQSGTCVFVPWCGDGTCDSLETCSVCAQDCGACVGVTEGFAFISAGSFWMGSPAGTCPSGYSGSCTSELGRRTDGREDLHFVRLTRDFEVSVFETTQGDWKAKFGGQNPSRFSGCGDDCPVERVSWFSALQYLNLLSSDRGYSACYELTECSSGTAAEGTLDGCNVLVVGTGGDPYNCSGYRLPTEAEWEYAARAGGLTAFHPSMGNDGSITQTGRDPLDPNLDLTSWYGGNSLAEYGGSLNCSSWYPGGTTCGTQGAGGKAPNAWGLYDTLGNISEWTWDSYSTAVPASTPLNPDTDPAGALPSSDRTHRGGAYSSDAENCRLAYRYFHQPGAVLSTTGLRPVRSLEFCGDGICNAGETCENCPEDCNCTGCGEECVGGVCLFSACLGKVCGDDGCGGACGTCATHYECQSGQCIYVPWCGDGTCNLDEDCDTCSEDCGACCGNGAVDDGEECDLGPMNSDSEADSCRTNCKNAHCGDGVIDAEEECDDGNQSNGDGCDSQCMEEPHGPFPGDIIITEIMNNPHLTADAFGEYFEVYNTRDYPIDINRWEIASSGDPVHTIEHSGPLLVPPFGYAVLGLSGDFELNGGVPVDYVYSNILLLNGADTLKISFNGTDIDVVAYDGGPEFPSPSGPSMNLDPDHFDHISNNNGASWCFSTEPLPSGDKGTPGQPNTPCP